MTKILYFYSKLDKMCENMTKLIEVPEVEDLNF